jgi:hypothetical protein
MECHKCKHNGKYEGVEWGLTPCATCVLREDSLGTMPYCEERAENGILDPEPDDEPCVTEIADTQSPMPYGRLEGDEADPLVPLSALTDAMHLWMNLSLPARKTFQLRMRNVPYAEIGRRLGCTRQAVEKLVAQAIAREPLLQNLLPAKAARDWSPLTAPRNSAIAGNGNIDPK